MTKHIRVENADTSDHKVIVHTEDFNKETNSWIRTGTSKELPYPTAMSDHTIWSNRRIVIEEVVE